MRMTAWLGLLSSFLVVGCDAIETAAERAVTPNVATTKKDDPPKENDRREVTIDTTEPASSTATAPAGDDEHENADRICAAQCEWERACADADEPSASCIRRCGREWNELAGAMSESKVRKIERCFGELACEEPAETCAAP